MPNPPRSRYGRKMNAIRHLSCLAMFTMMAGLSSCSRDQSDVVAVLEDEVCRLTEIDDSSRAQLSLLRAEANRLDAAIYYLKSSKSEMESEVYSMQGKARGLRLDLSNLVKLGMDEDHFVAGARLPSLGVGATVYRDVLIKQVTEHDVLIAHSDGIARLKKSKLMGMEEPRFQLKPLDLSTYVPPTAASMALKVSLSRPLQAEPVSRPSVPRVASSPARLAATGRISRVASRRPARPKTVEVLAWWGPGNPYRMTLTDSFGNRFKALPPGLTNSKISSPGPWRGGYASSASSHRGSSRSMAAGSGISGYKPIGWNYVGSTLDRLYGSRR